jgi:hypothetical protein
VIIPLQLRVDLQVSTIVRCRRRSER